MDEHYMSRVLELASRGWGKTKPNPLVGAIVVQGGHIVAEGYHHYFGGDHAEVDALKKIDFKGEGATLYVNLEPCSHYGKTPPCVEAIIKSGIKKVVVAMEDPNPLVAGRGIQMLREQGIEVITGVMEAEAKRLNEIFIKYITTGLPFCILKTAVTLDGKIATARGDSKWITGEEARAYVHHIRNQVGAILVGVSTVREDNPQLNTRIPNQEVSNPVRVILDSRCSIPIESNVVQTARGQKTIIVATDIAEGERINRLQDKGVEVVVVGSKDDKVDMRQLMVVLGEMKIDSVLIEGGGTVNYSALEAGIVDKVMYFIAPKLIGGSQATTSVEGKGKDYIQDAFKVRNLSVNRFGEDVLLEGYIGKGR